MFFYHSPFYPQYHPQVLLYQPYSGSEQLPIFNGLIPGPNLATIIQENRYYQQGIKTEDGQSKIQNQEQAKPDVKDQKGPLDSDYQPEKSRATPFYKNKNTETNLSNQIFSFLGGGKSQDLVLKLFENNEIKTKLFYKLMKKIKKSNRKYINRNDIIDIVRMKERTPSFRIYKKFKFPLELIEIKRIFRILVRYFLRNGCQITLLTSKKMNRNTLMEHLVKKREFQTYFEKQMTIFG